MARYVVSVARDFSKTPGPRKIKDGPFSGEKFFHAVLLPALKAHELIEVDLDGTEGYGSSFINEAFRSIVVVAGLAATEALRRVAIKSDEDEIYKEDAIDSIVNT